MHVLKIYWSTDRRSRGFYKAVANNRFHHLENRCENLALLRLNAWSVGWQHQHPQELVRNAESQAPSESY